jgi:Zn-dependent metalloprotease
MQTNKKMCAHHDCCCFIVPSNVLKKFSRDKKLSAKSRKAFADAAKFESQWREARQKRTEVTLAAQQVLPSGLKAADVTPPPITVFDCQNHTTLPGVAIANPDAGSDQTGKRAYIETSAVVEFYHSIFGRMSFDNAGSALISSIHYSVNYNNAFWNGSQMTYGDGDGNIFIDFTKGNDVICHELTHGVTQYTLGLNYENQAGGLNESISDVFGSMFRQWRNNQDVTQADWLIGADILGPGATSRGFTCLRDLAKPNDKHCLAKQPTHFKEYEDGMDPHESSGIPNLAFYKAAMALGGNSWTIAGRIWYQAMAAFGPSPNMTMKQFAKRTRTLATSMFKSKPAVFTAIDKAWKAVGL